MRSIIRDFISSPGSLSLSHPLSSRFVKSHRIKNTKNTHTHTHTPLRHVVALATVATQSHDNPMDGASFISLSLSAGCLKELSVWSETQCLWCLCVQYGGWWLIVMNLLAQSSPKPGTGLGVVLSKCSVSRAIPLPGYRLWVTNHDFLYLTITML